mmetsp:Transcript_22909/g.54027  ORF Transcript_22909/g.54027 Transcript_22909/m.54027 type:complete len:112 (-) Transcript_22909:1178-1513(-)
MPLVKLFCKQTLTKPIPLAALQQKLCNVWGTKPETTKLMVTRVDDWTSESFDEDVFVDIRSYAKPERTREFVLDGLKQVQRAFADHNLVANVRCESYDGERYWHVPPSSTK